MRKNNKTHKYSKKTRKTMKTSKTSKTSRKKLISLCKKGMTDEAILHYKYAQNLNNLYKF